LLVFPELRLRLGVGLINDDGREIKGQDLARIATRRGGLTADIGDIGLKDRLGRRRAKV
jgi:hypothetical protein